MPLVSTTILSRHLHDILIKKAILRSSWMARTTRGILRIKPLWQMAWYTAISLLGSFRTGVLIPWTWEAIEQRASRWRVTRNVEHRHCASPSKFGATSRTLGRQLRPWCWIRCVRRTKQQFSCECAQFRTVFGCGKLSVSSFARDVQ